MAGQIIGTGASIPIHSLTNQKISEMVDTSDEWIRERTGIGNRHIIDEETTVGMAADAVSKAMMNAGIDATALELLIVATVSSNVILPCTACEVQRKIGAANAMCFDVNAACTGFLTAMMIADCYLTAGVITTAAIVGAESLSQLMDWEDRSTCILFGDGAGAVILHSEESIGRRTRIPMILHSDGGRGMALTLPGVAEKNQTLSRHIQMQGKEIFKFAVRSVPEVILQLLEKEQKETKDIDYYILHQANQRIIEAIARRLKLPMSKFPLNIAEYGNTSSASIPILLDEMNRAGKLVRGMKIIIAGFGAGLSWGAAYLEW